MDIAIRQSKILSKTPDVPQAPDYRIRMSYWRYYCALRTGNTSLSDKLRTWLLREYPLSMHTLLAISDQSVEKNLPFQRLVDPEIHFRPMGDKGLQATTRMIENLLVQGMNREATDLLESEMDRVQITEIPFQIYWAVLLNRVGTYPSSFQLLASIFRKRPI